MIPVKKARYVKLVISLPVQKCHANNEHMFCFNSTSLSLVVTVIFINNIYK